MNDNALTLADGDGLEHLETILVVEDEPGVRRVIKLILEVQGYRVLAAENVEQALRLAETQGDSVDLLLTDVVLPGMSGPRLYEQLRSTREDLRVLFISGYPEEVLAAHGLCGSEWPFLAKPFTGAALSRVVRQLLRAGPDQAQHQRQLSELANATLRPGEGHHQDTQTRS
ncbi:MAG: response regulator [Aureliella sp.]